jgi:Bifunctional DNA primase/polymerase, N-terminal
VTYINDSEFEEPPEREPAWLRLDRATVYRKKLLAAGYLPIPVNGKAPAIQGWSDIQATDALIDRWADQYASAINTGTITADTPAIDIDVLDSAVADELHCMVEQMIGTSAVRTGLAPKRALLFRTDTPFKKLDATYTSLDGRTHKVEILGWGQQIVVHGIHPTTREAYTWYGGEPGPELKHDALPLLTEEKAKEFIAAAAQCMRRARLDAENEAKREW